MTSPTSHKQTLLSRPRRLIVAAGAAALLAAALPAGAGATVVPHVTTPKTVTPTVVAANASQAPAAAGPAASSAPAGSSAPAASASTPSAPSAGSPAPIPSQSAGATQEPSQGFGTGAIEDLDHLSGNPFKNNSRTAAEIQRAREFADAITNLTSRPGPILPPLPEPEPQGLSIHDVVCAVLSFVQLNDKISDPTNGAMCL
jgi:hypothetical protein